MKRPLPLATHDSALRTHQYAQDSTVKLGKGRSGSSNDQQAAEQAKG